MLRPSTFPTSKVLVRLKSAQTKTINLRALVDARSVQPVLRAMAITCVKDIAITLEVALLKAAVRQHGHNVLALQHET